MKYVCSNLSDRIIQKIPLVQNYYGFFMHKIVFLFCVPVLGGVWLVGGEGPLDWKNILGLFENK